MVESVTLKIDKVSELMGGVGFNKLALLSHYTDKLIELNKTLYSLGYNKTLSLNESELKATYIEDVKRDARNDLFFHLHHKELYSELYKRIVRDFMESYSENHTTPEESDVNFSGRSSVPGNTHGIVIAEDPYQIKLRRHEFNLIGTHEGADADIRYSRSGLAPELYLTPKGTTNALKLSEVIELIAILGIVHSTLSPYLTNSLADSVEVSKDFYDKLARANEFRKHFDKISTATMHAIDQSDYILKQAEQFLIETVEKETLK